MELEKLQQYLCEALTLHETMLRSNDEVIVQLARQEDLHGIRRLNKYRDELLAVKTFIKAIYENFPDLEIK